MSASASTLTALEYEERKRFLEDMKILVKGEQEEIYKILKASKAEYSENCNGVFFDICKLPAETFCAMKKFMEFCHKNRDEFAIREEEERKAQEALIGGGEY
jgi:hypothetical protein